MDNPTEPNVPTTTSTDQTITQNVGATPTVGESSAKSGPNYWMIAAIVLFLLVLVCGAGLAYFLMAKPSGQTAAIPIPTLQPTVSPTANLTENLRTYSNEKYSFSVTYPLNLAAVQAAVSGPVTGKPAFIITIADVNTIREGTDAPFDGFSIYAVPYANIGRLSSDEWVAQEKSAFEKSPRGMPSGGITERQLTVGGVPVIALKVSDNVELFYVLGANEAIVFSRNYANASFVAAFDQILSTFKFTHATQSNSGLRTIQDLTQPMVWSTPVTDSGQNYPGIMLQGESMTTPIPEKSQDKLAPLLATDSVLTSTYGWINDPAGSADGPNASIVTFKKTNRGLTQWMIIASNFSKKQYTVFVGVQE